MKTCVILTVLAPDRTGIVKSLSEVIVAHGGNWLESRMARLAGQFAGILRVEAAVDRADAMISDLQALEGVAIQATREDPTAGSPVEVVKLEVVGNDRPGIVRELSAAIASSGANLEELQTTLESAAMAGHLIFHARGTIAIPEELDPEMIIETIEKLGADLSVTVEPR
jgi:glycine cleavage system regulatory protein